MQIKKSIAVILPRGESIRNFVYSGIIDELRSNYHVILIAVKPNDTIWHILSTKSDELAELKTPVFSYLFRLFFEIYDLAHNRFMWSEAAKVRWKMRDVESKTFSGKFTRMLKKGLATFLANQPSLKALEKFDSYLGKKEKCVQPWVKFFQSTKPDIVFNTSHSHARNAVPCIYAAQKLNIKTFTFLFSWDNLTSQGRVVPRYDHYLSWNNKIKEDFNRMYPHISKSSVVVTGTPQFIGHYQHEKHLTDEEVKKQLGLEPKEQYFVYSSGMSHHMPFEPYVVGRIADIIRKLGPQYRLVVRTYAKDRYDVFDKLKSERPDIIIPDVQWEKQYQTPLWEDQVFFSSLLKHCVAGINVASTISLELCMFDKPAVNVGYNPPGKNIFPYNYTRFYSFDHYKPIVESGAVQVANDEKEMEHYLKEAIEYPGKFSRERKQLINDFFEGRQGLDVVPHFVKAINQLSS
ncbi:MAG: hypothetical protein ABJA57_07980 [Ginsengibacter sp.]